MKSQKRKQDKQSKDINGCLWKIVIFLFVLVIVVTVGGMIGVILTSEKESDHNDPIVEAFTLHEYFDSHVSVTVDEKDTLLFYVTPSGIEIDDLELVVDHSSIVECVLQEVNDNAGKRVITIRYRGLAVGEASFYIKDKAGEKMSEVIYVSVQEKQEQPEDNSRTVYLNYSGGKYHYSEACAGKTAFESTRNQAVKSGKEPCSNCVN